MTRPQRDISQEDGRQDALAGSWPLPAARSRWSEQYHPLRDSRSNPHGDELELQLGGESLWQEGWTKRPRMILLLARSVDESA
jgi:hypothetical protein